MYPLNETCNYVEPCCCTRELKFDDHFLFIETSGKGLQYVCKSEKKLVMERVVLKEKHEAATAATKETATATKETTTEAKDAATATKETATMEGNSTATTTQEADTMAT